MDDQRPNARRLTRPDLSAVGPAILSFVAKDVAPVPLVLRVDRSRVQLPLKDCQRIADVIAGATRAAAIHPVAAPGVVDSKTNVPIGSLRLITSGTGLERQRDSPPQVRIVLVKHVAEDVAQLPLRVDSGTESEVARAEIERRMDGDFDVRSHAVECSILQPDAVIDAVVPSAGIIAAITLEFPMADEPCFQLAIV